MEQVSWIWFGQAWTIRCVLAYQELRELRHSNDKVYDYRTAAFVVAIRKIARSYLDIGVY